MTKKIKGGLVILPGTNITFDDVKQNISKFTRMPISSRGGYLFTCDLKTPYKGIYPGYDTVIYDITKILMKIVQIQNPNEYIYECNGKEVISEQTFNDEVSIQKDILKKSLDFTLEPICPNIIFGGIGTLTLSNIGPFFSELKNIIIININQRGNHNFKYGIIAMECLSGTPVRNLFPNWSPRGPGLNEQGVITFEQNWSLRNYLYQIMRLRKIGYIHGDLHLGNAIYVNNYDYISNMRVYLIDFGKSHRAGNYSKFDIDEMLNIGGNDYWSYKILKDVSVSMNLKEKTNLDLFYKTCKDAKNRATDNFIRKLYNKEIIRNLRLYTNNLITIELDPRSNQTLKEQYSSSLIFVKNNALLATISSVTDDIIIRINMNNHCNEALYKFKSELYKIGDTNILYANLKESEYLSMYIDEQIIHDLKRRDPNAMEIDDSEEDDSEEDPAIYLWVIGYRQGEDNLRLFTLRSPSCYEIATKHYFIMKWFNIDRYYAAGEILAHGHQINVNIASGTYMLPIIENENPQKIEILKRSIITFIEYKLNKGKKRFTITSTQPNQTFFTPSFCCNDTNRKKEFEYMKYVAEYMPNIVEIQDQGRTGGRAIYNTNTQLVIQEPSIQKPSIQKPSTKIKNNTKLINENNKMDIKWEKIVEEQNREENEIFKKYVTYNVQYSQDVYPNVDLMEKIVDETDETFIEGFGIINNLLNTVKQSLVNKDNTLTKIEESATKYKSIRNTLNTRSARNTRSASKRTTRSKRTMTMPKTSVTRNVKSI